MSIPTAFLPMAAENQQLARYRQIDAQLRSYALDSRASDRGARLRARYEKYPWLSPGIATAYTKWEEQFGKPIARDLARAAAGGEDLEKYVATKDFQSQVEEQVKKYYRGWVDQTGPKGKDVPEGKDPYYYGIPKKFRPAADKMLRAQYGDREQANPIGDLVAQVGELPGVKPAVRAAFTALETPYQEVQALGAATLAGSPGGPQFPFAQDIARNWANQIGVNAGPYQPGSSTGAIALKHLAAGENVDLGEGYLPGGAVTKEHEQAVRNIASLRYGGQRHFATTGRFFAAQVVEPGTKPFNTLSGLIDAAQIITTDPGNYGLEYASDVAKARKGFAAPSEIERAGGFSSWARSFVDPPTVDQYLASKTGTALKEQLARTSPEQLAELGRRTGWKWDADTYAGVIRAQTPEEVDAVLRGALGTTIDRQPALNSFAANIRNTTGKVALLSEVPGTRIQIDMASLGGPNGSLRALYNHALGLGLDDAEISRHLSDILTSAGTVERSEALIKYMEMEKAGLLKRGVAPEDASRLTRFAKEDLAGNARRYFDQQIGTGEFIPGVAIDGTMFPLDKPYLLTEHLGDTIYLTPLTGKGGRNEALWKQARVLGIPGTSLGENLDDFGEMLPGIQSTLSAGARKVKAAAWESNTWLTHMQNSLWKPLALIRGAWAVRVLGEEQIRMGMAGYDNFFTHPISYIAFLVNKKKGEYADILDFAAEQRALRNSQAGAFGLREGERDAVGRIMARNTGTFGIEDPSHAPVWANKLAQYSEDPLMQRVAGVVYDRGAPTVSTVEDFAPSGAVTAEGLPELFHGSSRRFVQQPGVGEGSGAYNLMGPGFYATDDLDVAKTYMQKGRGTDPSVSRLTWTGDAPPRVLDAEQRMSASMRDSLRDWWGYQQFDMSEEAAQAVHDALDRRAPLSEFIKSVRSALSSTGEITRDYADETMDDLAYVLGRDGYDVLRYQGGVRTGSKEHNAYVFLDPGQVNVEEVARNQRHIVVDSLEDLKDEFIDGSLSHFREDLAKDPHFAEAGIDLSTNEGAAAYIDGLYDRLHYYTGGNGDLIGTVAHGRYKPDLETVARRASLKGQTVDYDGEAVEIVAHRKGSKTATVLLPDGNDEQIAVSMLSLRDGDGLKMLTKNADGVALDKDFANFLRSLPDEVKPAQVSGVHNVRESAHADTFVNWAFANLMDKPTSYLNRSTVVAQEYEAQMKRLRPFIDAGDVSKAEADTIAKAKAVDKLRDLLYDTHKRNRGLAALQLLFPFGEAWKEMAGSWARIIAENPQTIRKGQVAVTAARGHNPFSDIPGALPDAYGDKGFFFKDPSAGGAEMFVYPWSAAINEQLLGVPVAFTGQAQQLNMGFNLIPGVGPAFQVPAMWFMDRYLDNKTWDPVRNLISPYGTPEISDGFVEQILAPAWVKKFLVAAGTDPKGTSQNARALNGTIMDVLAAGVNDGTYDMSSPASMQSALKDAERKARVLYFLRGTFQFGAPAAPRPEFLAEKKNGKLVRFQVLRDAYYKLVEKDPSTASEKFMERFGEGALFVVAPKTLGTTYGAEFTQQMLDWKRDNKGIAADYPLVYQEFGPHPKNAEFSYEAYLRALADDEREGLTAKEWANRTNNVLGAIWYDKVRSDMGLKEGEAGSKSQQAYLREIRDQIHEDYPGWRQIPLDTSKTSQAVEELLRAAKDPRLKKVNAGLVKAVNFYADARNQALAQVKADGGGGDFLRPGYATGERWAPLREWLRGVADRIGNDYPQFRAVFEDTFAREMKDDDGSDVPGVVGGRRGSSVPVRSSPEPTTPTLSPYHKKGPYITKLSPSDEASFQQWVQANNVPFDPSSHADYDMRGYWKAQQSGDPRAKEGFNASVGEMHFPDTWKTPYHQSFSNESIYATKNAPHWVGNKLIDKNGRVVFSEGK